MPDARHDLAHKALMLLVFAVLVAIPASAMYFLPPAGG